MPALRLVQAEVSRLLLEAEGTEFSSTAGGGDVAEQVETAADEAGQEDEGEQEEEEEEDLVAAAIAHARASVDGTLYGSPTLIGAVDEARGGDTSRYKGGGVEASRCKGGGVEASHRRKSVWRCVAVHPCWVQIALVQILRSHVAQRSSASDLAGTPDVSFVVWCVCPLPPRVTERGTERGTESLTEEGDEGAEGGEEEPEALACSRDQISRWLEAVAAEVAALAAAGEAPEAEELCARASDWASRAGAHSGLLWQLLCAATCVAAAPSRWVVATLGALRALSGGADPNESASAMEWAWLLLSEAVHAEAPRGRRSLVILDSARAVISEIQQRRSEAAKGVDVDLAESDAWAECLQLFGEIADLAAGASE